MATIFRNVSILVIGLMTVATTTPGLGQNSSVAKNLFVFHAITSANGRFKTGEIMDVGAEGLDVYNTMVSAMGAKHRLGPAKRESRHVRSILA